MADVFEHLNALNRGGVYQLDIDSGLEAGDSSVNGVRFICHSHIVHLTFTIVTEEVVVKTDVEDLGVYSLVKSMFLAFSFQETLTSIHPFQEACIPVSQGIPFKPLFVGKVAPLKLVLEILQLELNIPLRVIDDGVIVLNVNGARVACLEILAVECEVFVGDASRRDEVVEFEIDLHVLDTVKGYEYACCPRSEHAHASLERG